MEGAVAVAPGAHSTADISDVSLSGRATADLAEAGSQWRWPLIIAVCLGAFVGMADSTIVAVGMEPLGIRFGIPLTAAQETIALYLVVATAVLPTLGRLGDRFGRRRVYALGFVVFGLGSLVCIAAPTFLLLLCGRAIQAVGGGTLTASSLALIAEHSPKRRTGRSVAIMVIMQAVAGLVAPPLGGLLVALGGWQAMFWVGVPIAAAGIALTLRCVPRSTASSDATIDPVGALLFGGILFGLGAGIASLGGPILGGIPAPAWLSVAWLSLLLLVPTELISKRPIVDGRLLRSPRFAAACVASFLATGTLMSSFALLPYWLEGAHHVSAMVAGVAFLPIGLGVGAMSRRGGSLGDQGKTRQATAAGMGVAACGLALCAWAVSNGAVPLLIVGLALLGCGHGLFSSPNTAAAMRSAPRNTLGSAAGLLSTARNAGVVVGLSLSAAVYTSMTAANHSADGAAAATVFAAAAAACVVVGVLTAITYRQPAATS